MKLISMLFKRIYQKKLCIERLKAYVNEHFRGDKIVINITSSAIKEAIRIKNQFGDYILKDILIVSNEEDEITHPVSKNIMIATVELTINPTQEEIDKWSFNESWNQMSMSFGKGARENPHPQPLVTKYKVYGKLRADIEYIMP